MGRASFKLMNTGAAGVFLLSFRGVLGMLALAQESVMNVTIFIGFFK